MSAVWTKLEALAAGDPAKFRKCSCDTSEHNGWTLDPAKEEISHGADPIKNFQRAVELGLRFAEQNFHNARGLQNARTALGNVPALLAKNALYRIPHNAEEERRRFRQDLRELSEPLTTFISDVIQESPETNWHWDWSQKMRAMEEEAPSDMMERLVWHHDPRLQLIHYPSFRCFVEVQLYQRTLRFAMKKYEAQEHQIADTDRVDDTFSEIDVHFRNHVHCVLFYILPIAKEEAMEHLMVTVPFVPAEQEKAGPSLTKAQRKRAEQKANKAAARLAKETAKASDTASSSRSDILPKTPAPKPPTAAPKKKKAAVASSSASAGETEGGSWAVVESGVEGGGEAQPSPEAPEVRPETEETAAVARSPTEEPRGESPEPPQLQTEARAEAQTQTDAPYPSPTEKAVTESVAVGTEGLRVAPPLPVVEAVVPSGAYAALASDLARIADRLRQDRVARSAH